MKGDIKCREYLTLLNILDFVATVDLNLYLMEKFHVNTTQTFYGRPSVLQISESKEGVEVTLTKKYFYGEMFKYYFLVGTEEYFIFLHQDLEIGAVINITLSTDKLMSW